LACRTKSKALETIKKIKDCPPGMLEFYPLDLNDLTSVKNFATYFNAKYDRLDILLNNAGIMALQERQFTKQGLEK
jgi:NADP-dependent 3-hydroxy acid dehydrogenase YdfG